MAVATSVTVLIWCQKNSKVLLQNRHIGIRRVTPARYITYSTSSIFLSRSASILEYTATSWTCNITTLAPCSNPRYWICARRHESAAHTRLPHYGWYTHARSFCDTTSLPSRMVIRTRPPLPRFFPRLQSNPAAAADALCQADRPPLQQPVRRRIRAELSHAW